MGPQVGYFTGCYSTSPITVPPELQTYPARSWDSLPVPVKGSSRTPKSILADGICRLWKVSNRGKLSRRDPDRRRLLDALGQSFAMNIGHGFETCPTAIPGCRGPVGFERAYCPVPWRRPGSSKHDPGLRHVGELLITPSGTAGLPGHALGWRILTTTTLGSGNSLAVFPQSSGVASQVHRRSGRRVLWPTPSYRRPGKTQPVSTLNWTASLDRLSLYELIQDLMVRRAGEAPSGRDPFLRGPQPPRGWTDSAQHRINLVHGSSRSTERSREASLRGNSARRWLIPRPSATARSGPACCTVADGPSRNANAGPTTADGRQVIG